MANQEKTTKQASALSTTGLPRVQETLATTGVGVTYADGFKAAGVTAGLKASGKPDFAIVQNVGPNYNYGVVQTNNRFAAAPILYSRAVMEQSNECHAVAVNSGSANACTGTEGYAQAEKTAQLVAAALNCDVAGVQVASTGKIAVLLDMPAIEKGVNLASEYLNAVDYNRKTAGDIASHAILTTDNMPKAATIDGAGYKIGGMVKGAGMIAPAMATMICVVTTDAVLSNADLQKALETATNLSFHRIDSDGCISTNDTVIALSSGASGVTPDIVEFTENLTTVLKSLARQIITDAEGASHDILITVQGASTQEAGLAVAREVSRSNLLKCALFGGDPNWGRVLASMGAVGPEIAPFDPNQVDVSMNGVMVCKNGSIGEDSRQVDLKSNRLITIEINLKAGTEEVELWTNDLTYEYVEINAEYST